MAYIEKGLNEVIYVRGLGKDNDIVISLSPGIKNFVCHIKKGDEQISVNGRYIRIEHWDISVLFDFGDGIVTIHDKKIKYPIRLIHRYAFIDNGEPEYSWWEYISNNEIRIINAKLFLENRKDAI